MFSLLLDIIFISKFYLMLSNLKLPKSINCIVWFITRFLSKLTVIGRKLVLRHKRKKVFLNKFRLQLQAFENPSAIFESGKYPLINQTHFPETLTKLFSSNKSL